MRVITYKYDIGDTVKIKEKLHTSASCRLKELAGTVAKIEDKRDYNGPCYKLEGIEGFFVERSLLQV